MLRTKCKIEIVAIEVKKGKKEKNYSFRFCVS